MWLKVAATVNYHVRKATNDAAWEVTLKDCYSRFIAVTNKKDPTGGANSEDPEVKQITILKDLFAEINAEQVRIMLWVHCMRIAAGAHERKT